MVLCEVVVAMAVERVFALTVWVCVLADYAEGIKPLTHKLVIITHIVEIYAPPPSNHPYPPPSYPSPTLLFSARPSLLPCSHSSPHQSQVERYPHWIYVHDYASQRQSWLSSSVKSQTCWLRGARWSPVPDNGRIVGGRLCEGMVHVEGGGGGGEGGGVSVRRRGGGEEVRGCT